MKIFNYKIPPILPLPTKSRCFKQGGKLPLFGKDGYGEIFYG